jgi:hypothetical protein
MPKHYFAIAERGSGRHLADQLTRPAWPPAAMWLKRAIWGRLASDGQPRMPQLRI